MKKAKFSFHGFFLAFFSNLYHMISLKGQLLKLNKTKNTKQTKTTKTPTTIILFGTRAEQTEGKR